MKGPAGASRVARFAMAAVWASFLAAGVMEALVFAVVDPGDLRWFGGEQVQLSAQAIYTVSFLIFWAVCCLGASVALLLVSQPDDGVQAERRSPGWPR